MQDRTAQQMLLITIIPTYPRVGMLSTVSRRANTWMAPWYSREPLHTPYLTT